MYLMLSLSDTNKRAKVLSDYKVKCKCSHTMAIPTFLDRMLCSHCGKWVYRTPELEEQYKKEEFKRKIGKMINDVK